MQLMLFFSMAVVTKGQKKERNSYSQFELGIKFLFSQAFFGRALRARIKILPFDHRKRKISFLFARVCGFIHSDWLEFVAAAFVSIIPAQRQSD